MVLYRRRAGVDRKVGYDRSKFAHQYGYGDFMIWPHAGTFHSGDRVFVRVERKVLDDGDVCRADRSLTKRWR